MICAIRDLLVERAVFVANLLAVMPDESMEIVETRKGISWHPVLVRKVNFTPGIMFLGPDEHLRPDIEIDFILNRS